LEQGAIFADPLALRILGVHGQFAIERARVETTGRGLRLFIPVRTRFAEDALARALELGVQQVVILGAGLDTYAYRASTSPTVRIFEVDHPDTQAWKRECLAAAGIVIPPALTYAPIDFERETLASGLAATGFSLQQRTFFSWLGVVPYLTESAIMATLRFTGALSSGAHVVFDYSNPRAAGAESAEQAALRDALAARVASIGEALQSSFATDVLNAQLAALGFGEIEDLGPQQIAARYFGGRVTPPSNVGGHVVHAATSRCGSEVLSRRQ
jgi:methyltransferase (TIGR00027 family)